MKWIDEIINYIYKYNRHIIPIIGLKGAGKTFFLASLTKWLLFELQKDGITVDDTILKEGKKYLMQMYAKYTATSFDSKHNVNSEITATQWVNKGDGELQKILLAIPPLQELNISDYLDLFTVDAPGEVFIEQPALFHNIVKYLNGIIVLVDLVGLDNENQSSINYSLLDQQSHKLIDILARVDSELTDNKPVAFVITKWDKILTFGGFEDEAKRRQEWELIKNTISEYFLPIVAQFNTKIFFHSSMGRYKSRQEAYTYSEPFPYPYGIREILKFFVDHII